MAHVTITPVAQGQFNALPVTVRQRLEKLFARLGNWPAVSGAKPLRGNLAGHFRLRTGDYRVQFLVAGQQVTIDKVGHRDKFYDE